MSVDFRLKEEEAWFDCRLCPLCEHRTSVVVGYGDIHAGLMIVGEGPGELEDERGIPFVGKSGQVLDKFLEYFGMGRDEVFVNNVVACRPEDNRDPTKDEMFMCLPRLRQSIYLVDPMVIVTLGAIAFKAVTDVKTAIGKARGEMFTAYVNRGEWSDEEGEDVAYAVIPTYHPSFLLRNMGSKNKPDSPWEKFHNDMEQAIKLFDKGMELYHGVEPQERGFYDDDN